MWNNLCVFGTSVWNDYFSDDALCGGALLKESPTVSMNHATRSV